MLFLSILSFQRNEKRSRIFKVRGLGWKEVSTGVAQGAFPSRQVRTSHCERKGKGEGKKSFSHRAFPEDAVKCFNTFACLSKDGENDTEFSLPGFSSRVPVLKTPFSKPEWQDPEFLRKVRGLEGMLRVRKSLERADGCASGLGILEVNRLSLFLVPTFVELVLLVLLLRVVMLARRLLRMILRVRWCSFLLVLALLRRVGVLAGQLLRMVLRVSS